MNLNTYAQAAGPAIKYAADARGARVPAFALVLAPMCPQRPTDVKIIARHPQEPGPDFHARVLELETFALALHRGQELRELQVMFINCLPSVEWRQRQLQRYALHWEITYAQNAMHRVAACGALARLAGLTYAEQKPC
jgi:hypothetical protein